MIDIYKSQKNWRKKNRVSICIDVSKEFKEEFYKACDSKKLKPATVLKDFMKNFIENI